MQVEAVRVIVAALQDSTTGVNAQLAALASASLLEGDTVPDDVTVYDETRHGWVARGALPSKQADGAITFPCLAVSIAAPLAWDLTRKTASTSAKVQDGNVTVAIEWFQKGSDTPETLRAASYTMRAVRGALAVLHDAGNAVARTRNTCALLRCDGLQYDARPQVLEDALVRAAMTATYHTHESTP